MLWKREWFDVVFLLDCDVVIGEGWGNLLKGLIGLFLLLFWFFDMFVVLLLEDLEVGGM